MMRRNLFAAALIAGLVVVGGLVGIGARLWALNERGTQLHQCVLASQLSHPDADARARLAYFDAEVPECMAGAGYEKALDSNRCSPEVWQGDVYCYLPTGFIGMLM
jgi:hypothetical protein